MNKLTIFHEAKQLLGKESAILRLRKHKLQMMIDTTDTNAPMTNKEEVLLKEISDRAVDLYDILDKYRRR